MRVYIIGAGPGAADLITIRGAKILSDCKVVMFAGSLVPAEILIHALPEAELIDTAQLSLPEQRFHYQRAQDANLNVARLHSGDPSIYGATAEQMKMLNELNIDFEIVPGVSSFSAAAAVLGAELTKPNVSQTIILTRTSGRASPVPERESLRELSAHQATLCLFLSGTKLRESVDELLTHYAPSTPVALAHRISQSDERVHRSTLGCLLSEIVLKDWHLTTTLLVGEALSSECTDQSRLYDPTYSHRFRKSNSSSGGNSMTSGSTSPKKQLSEIEREISAVSEDSIGVWILRSEAEAFGNLIARKTGGTLYRSWELEGNGTMSRFPLYFHKHRQWLLIMAGGIAVRLLTGLPADKLTDPAVCVIDEGGHFVVPLLCGHEGGANNLAFRIAQLIGAEPVITTATEARKTLAIGIGTRRGVTLEDVEACVLLALAGRSIADVSALATITLKAEERGILDFCQKYDIPMRVFNREALKSRGWVTEPSDWVMRNIGIEGVCEPCALMVSPRSILCVPKVTLRGVAVAISETLPALHSNLSPSACQSL